MQGEDSGRGQGDKPSSLPSGWNIYAVIAVDLSTALGGRPLGRADADRRFDAGRVDMAPTGRHFDGARARRMSTSLSLGGESWQASFPLSPKESPLVPG